jgi:hypothetical protein
LTPERLCDKIICEKYNNQIALRLFLPNMGKDTAELNGAHFGHGLIRNREDSMFDIFERIDAAKEHHEQLLAEAEQHRRFPDRKANPVQFVAKLHPIRVRNFLVVIGMRLKALPILSPGDEVGDKFKTSQR